MHSKPDDDILCWSEKLLPRLWEASLVLLKTTAKINIYEHTVALLYKVEFLMSATHQQYWFLTVESSLIIMLISLALITLEALEYGKIENPLRIAKENSTMTAPLPLSSFDLNHVVYRIDRSQGRLEEPSWRSWHQDFLIWVEQHTISARFLIHRSRQRLLLYL